MPVSITPSPCSTSACRQVLLGCAGLLWTVAALAADGADGAARAGLPDSLKGLWTVQDSACAGCDPTRGAEAGAELRLGGQGYQNPFAHDCAGGLATRALPGEALDALQQRLGLPAGWLSGGPAAATGGAAQAQGFQLLCAGAEALTLVLLPDGHLLMPVEASTVLRFRRSGG